MRLPGGRRRRGNLDGVVGKRRRPAVRQIGLVDEDDLHAAARRPKRLVELRGDATRPTLPAARACASSPWWKWMSKRGVEIVRKRRRGS